MSDGKSNENIVKSKTGILKSESMLQQKKIRVISYFGVSVALPKFNNCHISIFYSGPYIFCSLTFHVS